MTTRHVRQPTLDCAEPRELAEFYRRLLGWDYAPGHEGVDPDGDDFLLLIDPDRPVRLAFQRSDAVVAPWRVGARVHVDLDVEDLDVAHEDAVRLGARPLTGTPAEEGHADDPFRVYADPSGHPFCLCLPDPDA